MVKKFKPKLMRLVRVSPDNHEILASLCTKKGMSFNDALNMVLKKAAIKPDFEKRELLA